MITQITDATELAEVSGGRFSRSNRFSRTGKNTAESIATARGDVVKTRARVKTTKNSVTGSSTSSSSSSSSATA